MSVYCWMTYLHVLVDLTWLSGAYNWLLISTGFELYLADMAKALPLFEVVRLLV